MIPNMKHLRALILGASLSAIFAMVVSTPTTAVAQADLGSVSGTVTDASGAVIPKAQVTVTNNATGAVRTTTTNGKGEYAVSQIVSGLYTVSITANGFAPASQAISVTVGSSNTFSAKLAVSGGKTEVIVNTDDFAGVQLEKPEVATVIETQQILSLPTVDRDPYGLVAFSGNLSADSSAASRGVGFNISGARSTSVDILLDGVENTDMFSLGIGQSVPMDATAEMRIVTSNSGVEYGRGAGAVNVSTKSGTNGLHGSVYEYNRVSTLGSAGYNNNYIHAMEPGVTAKPRFTHNQFGYSIGGPVKKDKLFFFSSTEWTRIRSAQNVIASVPTDDLIKMSASNMQEFFSTYGTLEHKINGDKYNGAAIQKLGIWKDVLGSDGVMNYYDVTNLAAKEAGIDLATLPKTNQITTGCSDTRIASTKACTTNLFGEAIYQVPADSGGGSPINQWISFNRGDWTINSTTSLFGRYIQQSSVYPDGVVNNSPYAGYNTGEVKSNHSLEISLSKAITQNLASATKLLGSRMKDDQPLGKAPVGPTLYINAQTSVPLGGGTINFPGYSATSPGTGIPSGGPQNFIQVGEDLAWSKGKHQFTFGGNFLYIKDNRMFGAYEEAVDGLKASGTNGALENFIGGGMDYLNVAVNPNGAYPCAKDAAGKYPDPTPAYCQIKLPVSSPNFSRSNRFQDGSLYAGDSFKVSPKLTVNYGIRWEIYGPQHSQKKGLDSNFFPDYTKSNIWDQIRSGKLMTRENAPDGRLWNLNKTQFAPKAGFAYDPFGNGKTSIRGGLGLNYERNFNNVTFNVIQNPPNYAVVAFQASTDNNGVPIPVSTNNFSTFGTGTGAKALPNVNLRAVDPKIKPAYSLNWSLSVERQFASTTASLSYVGTRGIHNYSIANVNPATSGSVYEGDARASNRLNYQYGNINWRGADGDSYYHGLTGELRSAELFHTGLNVRADYTWSHSIDNSSSTFTDGASNALITGYLNPFLKGLDRGSSDFDQKHRVTSAIVWSLPFAKRTTGLTKLIADNWTLSTTFNAQTGTPYTEFDCTNGYNVCPRAGFMKAPSRNRTGDMKDLSADYGPNTFSYMKLPDYSSTSYAEVSDIPDCSGLHGAGCHMNLKMDGRNAFRGPGSWRQDLGVVKDFKVRERFDLQLKGEFINLYNHANTYLNLGGANDVSSYTDVLAYKSGNRNTELSIHIAF